MLPPKISYWFDVVRKKKWRWHFRWLCKCYPPKFHTDCQLSQVANRDYQGLAIVPHNSNFTLTNFLFPLTTCHHFCMSRVDADSSVPVWDFTDTDKWRCHLYQEQGNPCYLDLGMIEVTSSSFELGEGMSFFFFFWHEFCHTKKANNGTPNQSCIQHWQLYIVLNLKGDLSEIGRDYPDLRQQKYFKLQT